MTVHSCSRRPTHDAHLAMIELSKLAQRPARFIGLLPRPLTEDERALIHHARMYGSDGYPIARYKRSGWTWSFLSVKGPPTVFRTKREAVVSLEAFIDVLREHLAYESWETAARAAIAKDMTTERNQL